MEIFLSSYDYEEFYAPRKIVGFQKGVIANRNVLIAEIDTPVIGQKYGFGDKDITKVYLVIRFDDSLFEKLDTFPIDVYILIPHTHDKIHDNKSFKDFDNIAWGRIYNNLQDAKTHRL